jgi:toxin ParE1/3/4
MKSLLDSRTDYAQMANYKLTPDAVEDLWRIYQWGFRYHGEAAADQYYAAFFERFEQIAEQPLLYPPVDHLRKGYRSSVCGVDTIYYRIQGEIVEVMAIVGRQDHEEAL